jgi:hypothetical protein
MARFQAFVKPLTPDDPAAKLFAAGITSKPVGETLGELLERTGGAYEVTLTLGDPFREDIRRAAALTADSGLAAIAQNGEVRIPFEHLRGVDLETRVVVRGLLVWDPGEAARLGRVHQGPFNPRDGVFGAGSPLPEE